MSFHTSILVINSIQDLLHAVDEDVSLTNDMSLQFEGIGVALESLKQDIRHEYRTQSSSFGGAE